MIHAEENGQRFKQTAVSYYLDDTWGGKRLESISNIEKNKQGKWPLKLQIIINQNWHQLMVPLENNYVNNPNKGQKNHIVFI
jgi:hypothetical protein